MFFQDTTFFAAGSVFADFEIAVIFYHIIKTLQIFAYYVLPHSDFKFEGKNQFENMLKIVQKMGRTLNLLDFRIIFNKFAKLIFAL